jgi:hypothetical protein
MLTTVSIMILFDVSDLTKILKKMNQNPNGVRFAELRKLCEFYFGKPRQSGSSHCIFKTQWPGDPRFNIQNHRGKAKPYQVRQVLKAIQMLEANNDI